MTGLVLGNVDYLAHTSSEGQELQQGLVEAGWAIGGVGYGDGCKNVAELLERHQPDAVFVQDVRDWLPQSDISFRKDLGFNRIEALGEYPSGKFTILKDAWGWADIQGTLCHKIRATAIAHYYHESIIRSVAPWAADFELIRIHHSIDADYTTHLLSDAKERKRAIVTGADSPVYPMRTLVRHNISALGVDTRKHPGYGNRGTDTPAYLRAITGYRVHVACSSKWGAAFRKIIESVACGCTPVTDLPEHDVLPEIDDALVRVPQGAGLEQIKAAIDAADDSWDFDERMRWAAKARAYYDWRISGQRFSMAMERMSNAVCH